ncbi:MAG: ParB/RepB/Spo0J family partition protein [Thaumarchaeota archaeon]|nr:ParB/RepB/Spo0J family partition protein [Nitrososphaerota archaeon]
MKKVTALTAVSIERIHPNTWNPNSMKPEIFDALVQDIKQNGFLGAILVRTCLCKNVDGHHYEIIDGEHRWLACQDRRLDMKEIQCYVVERDDISARIETVTRNREHGELVKEKFAKLVTELKDSFKLPLESIKNRMMIPDKEFSLILNPVSAKAEPIKKVEFQGRRQSFTVSASIPSKQQYDMIMQTLEDVMKKEQCDKGYAMVKIFSEYGSVKP